MWKFKNIEQYDSDKQINFTDKKLAFYGNYSLDERGKQAFKIVSKFSKFVQFKYNELEFNFNIDSEIVNRNDIYQDFFKSISVEHILIEATTLSFAEILYLLSYALQNNSIKQIQILYIEPNEYKFHNSSITTYDEFSLSDKFQQYPPLPGFTINAELEETDLIAFLGFEKTRLGQIFSTEEIIYNSFTPVVPLPGFSPGWENRTINNHLKFFDPKYFFTEIKYVSANNPYQAYMLLDKMSQTKKNFRVAPIGTKPNAIGCAVFLVNTEKKIDGNYGALYDFPVKSKKRSEGIGKIHIYNLYKISN